MPREERARGGAGGGGGGDAGGYFPRPGRRIIDGLELPIYGDGTAVRDYLHVADHCSGIEAALFRGAAGEAYNLGTGVETSGNQVAAAVCGLMFRGLTRPH